jgi:hypothetical protein
MRADDGYIDIHLWGKDHWSTLAYIETVMVECGGSFGDFNINKVRT